MKIILKAKNFMGICSYEYELENDSSIPTVNALEMVEVAETMNRKLKELNEKERIENMCKEERNV